MRKLFLTTVIPLLILSCKKDDDVNPAEVRLQKVESVNPGAAAYTSVLDYDQMGMLRSISGIAANGTSSITTTIAYTGFDIVITPAATHSPSYDGTVIIRYTMDGAGNPLKRIQTSIDIFSPPNNSQYTYTTDTTVYEYSNGLLAKSTGSKYDSVWFQPAGSGIQITVTKTTSNAIYTNTGNRLTKITRNSNSMTVVNNSGSIHNFPLTSVETSTFGYTKGYSNQTDFTNATLLSELGLIFDPTYPINKAYSNFPDQLVYSITKNSSGQIITDGSTTNVGIGYNRYGFISDFDYSGQYRKNLIYNK